MPDTPRTRSYILTTLLQDGQGVGAINPQDMRDVVVSGPQWDEVSSVSKPYILRGSVDAVAYIVANGGGTGSMSGTPSVRATNGTLFQDAVNLAEDNNKFFEFQPATIEINNAAGITVHEGANSSYRGLTWRGTRGSIIKQFASNAPILTLGQVSTGAIGVAGIDFEGVWVQYGGSQAGNTSAIAFRIGSLAWCTIKKVDTGVPADTSTAPYIGFRAYTATASQWIFSCTFEDIKVWMAQNTLMSLENLLTGNAWSNIYLNNGAVGTFNAITGNFLFIDSTNGNGSDAWEQLNCEWGDCNKCIYIVGPYAARFGHVHVEGIKLTGTTPAVFVPEDGSVTIDCLEMTNPICKVATTSIVADWNGDAGDGSSNVRINNFFWKNYDLGVSGGNVTQTVSLFSNFGSSLGGDQSIVRIDNGLVIDDLGDLMSRLQFDPHMPVASHKMPTRWQGYEYGTYFSRVEKAIIPVSAAATIYGQHDGATIYVPASITSFDLTLSTTMGATGNATVMTGKILSVLRLNGTWSGTLTVKDGGGTTLTTSNQTGAQSATRYWYRFNGTAWATFTPVS